MSESESQSLSDKWEIPDTWSWARAGDIALIVGGGTPSTSDTENFAEGTIPWITPADLSKNKDKIVSAGDRFLTEKGLQGSGARVMPEGTVLFSSRAPIGYVAIAGRPVTTNQGFKSFIPSGAITSDYLYYYLQFATPIAKELASGTTFLEISGAKTAEIPVPVAPRTEQKRIVAEIEKQFTRLDAATAALKRVQANLKRYRASVLKAACEGRLVPTEAELARKEGRDYEPADKLLERILRERRARWEADTLAKMIASGKPPKDELWKRKYKEPAAPNTADLPKLPEGWCWVRAEQVCEFITKGTTPSANEMIKGGPGVPFIKVYNLTFNGSLDFSIDPTFVSKSVHEGLLARSKVYPGDVLMNIVGPPLGKVSLVPDHFSQWNTNQAVAIFHPIEGLDTRFLVHLLMTSSILDWAVRRSKATAGQFNLTLEVCRDLPLPVAPLQEQQRISALVDKALSAVDHAEAGIETQLRRANSMRQAILASAFSGHLVEQDPEDEPASVLLEHIRAERNANHKEQRGVQRRVNKSIERRGRKLFAQFEVAG